MTLTEAQVEHWKHYLSERLFAGEPENVAQLNALCDLALAQIRAQGQAVAWRYVVNGAHTLYSSVPVPDDAYDEGTLVPLFTAPQPAQGMVMPTLEQCFAAGKGPEPDRNWNEGGLPNTPEERARFEAYMKGHCWAVGTYNEELKCYDNTLSRMLYGVWRDRGALAAAQKGEQP